MCVTRSSVSPLPGVDRTARVARLGQISRSGNPAHCQRHKHPAVSVVSPHLPAARPGPLSAQTLPAGLRPDAQHLITAPTNTHTTHANTHITHSNTHVTHANTHSAVRSTASDSLLYYCIRPIYSLKYIIYTLKYIYFRVYIGCICML